MNFIVAFGLLIIAIYTNVVSACPDNCYCSTTTPFAGQVNVDCDSKGLTVIPRNFNNDSYSINMHNNSITIIEEGTFQNMTLLYQLDMNSCEISTIERGAFINLPILENLYLHNNRITTIHQGTFVNLPALKVVNLFNNQVATLTRETLADIPALYVLYLADNTITTIQQGAFEQHAVLQRLDVVGNNFTFVKSDTFTSNPSLRFLYLELICDCINAPFWSWIKSFPNRGSVTCLDQNNVQLSSLPTSDFENCTDYSCHPEYCSNGGSCSQNNNGDLDCSCVGGWIGKKCTDSSNLCAENVDNFNTKWSITAQNTIATLKCSGYYTGYVSRYCSSYGKWEEPNYSNCINLENITRDNNELRSGDLLTSSAILNGIAKYVTKHKDKHTSDQLEIFGTLCNNLLDDRNYSKWNELNVQDKNLGVHYKLIDQCERARWYYFTRTRSFGVYKAFNDVLDGEFSLVVARQNVVIQIGKTSSDEIHVPDRLKTSDSWISETQTKITLTKNTCSGLTGYSSTFYKSISGLFPKYLILDGNVKSFNGSYDVNSIITDFTIHGTSCLDFSVIIKFDHLLDNMSMPFCGHWNFSAINTVYGAWSSFGSRLVDASDSYTICEYNHTTNFAILMSPGKTPSSHYIPLSVISAIGCGVSILFLVITILIHMVLWRYVRNERTQTLMNLCVALLLSYVIFLAGISRTGNKVRKQQSNYINSDKFKTEIRSTLFKVKRITPLQTKTIPMIKQKFPKL
ncbi:leucine-rich repeat-containing G protein-coupled receptor 5 [Mytilus galloprovincialis]|nr:leucine-rich repeat-containing G protein-coupled receptor 5 [Mytilus galloprovincialis]